MVARTINSQGLTDQGILSVYVNTAPASGVWSLDLEFEFFTDINFAVLADVNLLLTSAYHKPGGFFLLEFLSKDRPAEKCSA